MAAVREWISTGTPDDVGAGVPLPSTAWNAQAVIALLVFLLAVFTFWSTRRRDRRLKEAELLRNYTNDFYGDPRMTSVFMQVDHGTYALGPTNYGTDRELALIRLLDFLNVLGHNRRHGIVELADLAPTTLGYAAVRIYSDPVVRSYLAQITRWDQERYLAGTGFGYFRQLAEDLEIYGSQSSRQRLFARIRLPLTRPPRLRVPGR